MADKEIRPPGIGALDARYLQVTNNLSDLADAATARANLGLGALAVLDSIDISTDTNLAVTSPIVLTDDTLSLDQSAVDHGSLGGLADDDHTIYILANGTRALTSDWDIGNGRKIQADEIAARDGAGLKLYDDGGNGIFVEDGGNVGIGTTDPQSFLDIQGPVGTGATGAGILTLATKELTIVDGDQLGRINFNAPLATPGGDSILAGAAIWAEADGTFSATSNKTELVFATANTSVAIERMRITDGGLVGIGIEKPTANLHISSTSGTKVNICSTEEDSECYLRFLEGISAAYGLELFYDGVGNELSFRNFVNYSPTNIIMTIERAGNVGIGTTSPLAKLHIDQATSDAAIPVLSLDQADISDGFINYIGASAANAAGPISTWTTGNTIQGFVRKEINGAQYWMPYYDAPTA